MVVNMKWVISGDFNEFTKAHEKERQATYTDADPSEFRDAIGNAKLTELEYSGGKFTWNNGVEGGYFTKIKLT